MLHSRIGSLAKLHLPRFAGNLRKLCLRQNIISHLDPEVFHQLTLLEELDLYDNKIKNVGEALDKLKKLTYVLELCSSFNTSFLRAGQWRRQILMIFPPLLSVSVLDLSFNLLRAVPDRLGSLPSLDTIFFVQNKISKIAGLNHSVTLRSLELGGNRIRVGGTHPWYQSLLTLSAEDRRLRRTGELGRALAWEKQDHEA